MNPEQSERLVAAAANFEKLVNALHPEDDTNIIEFLIEQLNGTSNRLTTKFSQEELNMPRGRKRKETQPQPAAVGTFNNGTIGSVNGIGIPTHVAVPQDRDQLITEWKQASDALREMKEKEHALRQALVASCFDGNKLEGTETCDIGYGWSLKATKAMNYSASNKNGETAALIAELEMRGEKGAALAEKLISWKPDVSKPVYREVFQIAQQYNDTALLEALHKTITIKAGMPELEMVPPAPAEAQPETYQVEKGFVDSPENIQW